MRFTDAQYEAVTCRDGSVLVSAGAGSGKTRVLTERLMEYIDPKLTDHEPEDIDSFLVITFTRAAAGELRARVTDAIAARLRENPSNAHLRRQLILCRTAEIGTIHSFCASILREYAGALGISPAFRILEEEKSERLRQASLERVMESQYDRGEESFLNLVDQVGAGRDDSRLAEMILRIHASIQSHARPEAWTAGQIEELGSQPDSIEATAWGRDLMKDAAEEVSFWRDEMEQALSEIREDERLRKAYEGSFSATADALFELEHALQSDWDRSVACLPVPFPRIGVVRDSLQAGKLKKTRERCRKAMDKLSAVFSGPSAALLSDLRETAPAMKTLLVLTMELDREFGKAKARANAMDFSDLEHLAIRLLLDENGDPTAAAKEISGRFREIMVDEYQDVSRVQDSIFHAVSREGKNLFFVGDLKQSIYRFRLADPDIFNEKSRKYQTNSRGERVVRLQENFRSRPEVLDAVNDVFCRCMSARLGNLDYGPDDALIPGNPPADGRGSAELLLLPREEAENTDLEAEAELVAKEILRLTERENVQFGDIAVLLRSANMIGGVFRRVLLGNGIPVSAGSGSDFYGSTEVSMVFSMLSVMDNPHRDIPLISLLSSPAFGFTADRLSMIRSAVPDADFYTALCASKDERAEAFLLQLRRLRTAAPDLNSVELVERVCEELDLYSLTAAMPDGEQRLQRLMDLVAMAETFRGTGEYGLHRFVRWLENMEKKGREPETCGEGGNAVRILSIHKSKGLEFPVVFVSGLGRGFNRKDTQDAVLVHPELGLGPKRTDPVRKLEYPTAARRAVERRITREMLSEEMRLLYVAMTRAEDRLFLTACVRKADEQIERASYLLSRPKIPAVLMEDASCALQWVLPSAVKGEELGLRICLPEKEAVPGPSDRGDVQTESEEAMLEQLDRNLRWRYPNIRSENLPSKLTATELKTADPDAAPLMRKRGKFQEPDLDLPAISSAHRGTVMHLVLQMIDLSQTGSKDQIRQEVRRLEETEFLTHEEALEVDIKEVYEFFRTPLGLRIRKAERIWREFRFSLLTVADALLPGESGDEKILLQGVVDCFFREGDSLVLVDYKTDHVKREKLEEHAETYRTQLETYAGALERIFGMRVKEKTLYFLSASAAVTLP